MTDCLITSDRLDGFLIKPEGLNDYIVPASSKADATIEHPKGNHNDVKPTEVNPDVIADGCNEVLADGNIFALNEDDGERNAFDFIDNVFC